MSWLDRDELVARLSHATGRAGVPGAAIGVAIGDERAVASVGSTNLSTGVEATDDTVWQIGSITKAFLATAVVELAREGIVDLDAPVRAVLPELSVADEEVSAGVTLRDLLSHRSGIEGDLFADFGDDRHTLARYVEACRELGQVHPLRATMSYCNSGYVIAGHAASAAAGRSWLRLVRERVFDPLALEHTGVGAESAILHRAATGHLGPPGRLRRAPRWGLAAAMAPAGGVWASIGDLLSFASAHFSGGRFEEASRVMREPQVELPDRWTLGTHWGLGWILFDYEGGDVAGHDGSTVGQSAFLRFDAGRRCAIALLTNGGGAADAWDELQEAFWRDVAGVAASSPPAPAAAGPVAAAPLLGRYERLGARYDVFERDGGIWLRAEATGPLKVVSPEPEERRLHPVRDGLFVMRRTGERRWTPVVFFELGGTPFLHTGMRATPAVA